MGLISRGNKSTGGTDLSDGAFIIAEEFDVDYNRLYNLVNGNLDDDNLAAAAAILLTKINDASSNAAAQKATVDPGTSGSETLATDGETEIQQLRYAIERLALGIDANRNDGSAKTSAWTDLPYRPGNLLINPVFALQSGGAGTAPDGWTLAGTPTTAVVQASSNSEGSDALELNVVADASDEGIQQTLAGLKASTTYLVLARVKVNVQNARLVTSGADATSSFRDVDVSTSSGSFTWLPAVVATDSSATDITVQVVSNASADDFDVSKVLCFECSATPQVPGGDVVQTEFDSSRTYAAGGGDTDWIPDSGNNPSVTVPGPGYYIEVLAYISAQSAAQSSGTLTVDLHENTGGGFSQVETSVITASGAVANEGGQVSFHHHVFPAVSGTTYTYKIVGNATGVNFNAGDARVTLLLKRASN